MTKYLLIGEVLKPQGIKGEVKIRPYAEVPDDFHEWDKVYVLKGDVYSPVPFRCSRVHDGFAYGWLNDVQDANEAEAFRGLQLYISREQAGEPEDGVFYIADLLGCEAKDTEGRSYGILSDVLQHGSVDVYVFNIGRKTMMAPALKDVFAEIRPDEKLILVDAKRLNEVAVFED